MELSRGGGGGSTDTFPFQTIMEDSWDCGAHSSSSLLSLQTKITCVKHTGLI